MQLLKTPLHLVLCSFSCEARNVLQQQYGVLTLRELPLGIIATQQELHLPIPYSNDQVQVQVEARGRVEVTQEQLKLMQVGLHSSDVCQVLSQQSNTYSNSGVDSTGE